MIIDKILQNRMKKEWRKRNSHNETFMNNIFQIDRVSVGNYTYGDLTVLSFNEIQQLSIGNFCSIASGVTFVLSADHITNHISTFPFKVKTLHSAKYEAISKGDIVVDDDVWIGQNAVILSGVHIGQGAVIAAGAVVNKDVAPYTIVGGIPAKPIKRRFSENLIEELMKIDYGKIDKKFVEDHLDDFYEEITSVEQVQRIIGENK